MKIEKFFNKKERKHQYRARFQINKKEFFPSADTRQELTELIDEIKVQERREKRGFVNPEDTKKPGPTVELLFEKTLSGIDLEENRHRFRFFERIFNSFLKIIPSEMPVTELKKTHFQQYYNWRKIQKAKQSKKIIKPGSIYKEIYGIRGAFSKADTHFAELEGWSPPSVPQGRKQNRQQTQRTRIVSKDNELEKLLVKLREPRAWRQTDRHHFHRIRLADNLEFRYETGLRRKEVARLERKNFHPEENALRNVVRWKTGTVTPFFPLTRRAQEIITERLGIQPDSNFIFSPDGDPVESDYRTLKEVCAELGINYGRFNDNGFVPHDLRHNFATEIIENTDIETARELLGHSNIGQTGGYLHTNENRLKDAMRRRDGFELKTELVVIYKAVRRGRMTARRFIEMIKKLT